MSTAGVTESGRGAINADVTRSLDLPLSLSRVDHRVTHNYGRSVPPDKIDDCRGYYRFTREATISFLPGILTNLLKALVRNASLLMAVTHYHLSIYPPIYLPLPIYLPDSDFSPSLLPSETTNLSMHLLLSQSHPYGERSVDAPAVSMDLDFSCEFSGGREFTGVELCGITALFP